MPRGNPPVETAAVRHVLIPAGHLLWRISTDPAPSGDALFSGRLAPLGRPTCPDELAVGGRFDATAESSYRYGYLALDDLTAVAETVLRDIAFTEDTRAIPRSQVLGRRLAVFEVLTPLRLVALTTAAELASARQDTWLIHAEVTEYWMTRRWGHWLRRCSPEAHGLIWPSKRNPGGQALVLFEDRCGSSAVAARPLFTRDLDGAHGERWLNRRLQELYAYIAPERRGTSPELDG